MMLTWGSPGSACLETWHAKSITILPGQALIILAFRIVNCTYDGMTFGTTKKTTSWKDSHGS